MTKQFFAVIAALFLLCSLPLSAQRILPRAIRFQGAPQYTQQELLAASGLKPGRRLTSREVKAHARRLNDTGLFKEVKFRYSRRTLFFTLTPSSRLFPMHLENVPLTPGKELDAKLRERFPLYHGLLPASGSMVEEICHTFEEMLAAKGIKATVKATLTSGLGPHKLTAVDFAVVSPAVRIGHIQLVGVSPAMQAKAGLLALEQGGSSFDTENTTIGLQHIFEDLYQEQGYAAVQVNVAQGNHFTVSNKSVYIPYTVTVNEGGIYKLGSIDLPSNALVTHKDVKKILSKYPRGSKQQLDLFIAAVHDAYNVQGYLDSSVVSHPSFNEARHIVNYRLEIAPGPQYRLASVKFEGAPQAMAARLKLAWKMAPGDVFDQSYLTNFAKLAQKKDKHLRKWMQSVITTYDIKADPDTHQVKCVYHFSKAVGSR